MAKKNKKTKKKSPPGSGKVGSSHPTQSPKVELFKVGDRVVLTNLATVRYNGRRGVVVSLPDPNNEGRYGIRVDGEHKPLAFRPRNVSAATTSTETTKPSSSRPRTHAKRQQRDEIMRLTDGAEEEMTNADQMAFIRMITSTFMTEQHQVAMYGRTIDPLPDFCTELLNRGEIPEGVDLHWAHSYLRLAYEQSSALPHMHEMWFKSADYKPEPYEIFKRLTTNHPSKVQWYERSSPGDICPRRITHPYSELVRHSFSNQAYRKEKLCRGTTHVAVGFVDLGMLFAADLDGQASEKLSFVGVDASPYAVAKTVVLWEMLKQSHQQEEYASFIVQAWFSTTWTEGTHEAVKSAVSVILDSDHIVLDVQVRKILDHWNGAPPCPLEEARSEHASVTTNRHSAIAHMISQKDQIALAKYELTGDFGLAENKALYGNLLMFDCPDGTPPVNNDESVFSAFSWEGIMDILKNNSATMTVMQAAEAYALNGVRKLANWATSDHVTVECICADIREVVDEVAPRKPWTMSWSNLVDYLDYSDFHELARRCSIHGDTIHFGYSMNWVTEVYGTVLIDYMGPSLAEFRSAILDQANKSVKMAYQLYGWDRYLRLPPPTNPINTTSQYGLNLVHYKTWARHFFEIAQRQGPCRVANIEMAMGASPLSSTGASTVAFTYTYDPDIRFNMIDPSLLF